MRRYPRPPILHVHITDEAGKLLADVDAISTADALAYYVTSRRIDDAATAASVAAAVGADNGPTSPIVLERRHPITGALELQLAAQVAP